MQNVVRFRQKCKTCLFRCNSWSGNFVRTCLTERSCKFIRATYLDFNGIIHVQLASVGWLPFGAYFMSSVTNQGYCPMTTFHTYVMFGNDYRLNAITTTASLHCPYITLKKVTTRYQKQIFQPTYKEIFLLCLVLNMQNITSEFYRNLFYIELPRIF